MTTGFDRRNDAGSDDPTTIRSIAVTVDDVLTALEARQRADEQAVLRVMPPFAGRMRARLHVVGGEGTYDDGTEPLHIDPGQFVDDTVAGVPLVDETEDELRDRGEYSVERHREFHERAVDSWRRTVVESLVDELTVEVGADDERDDHRVEVRYLGRRSE
jgi:hypothetical protein